MILSHTEENYIKGIYQLSETEGESISTNSIAELMDTKPASVSDMIKRLASKDLVNYQKYKGVSLTNNGLTCALKIVRKHRLWEVFLVDKLKFNWDEVHDIAEQLEHIQSPVLVQKLDNFLGHPTTDPHGDPIPNEDGSLPKTNNKVLAEFETGEDGIVTGVNDSSTLFLQHLDKIGISLGAHICVLEKMPYDSSLKIKVNHIDALTISEGVAKNLNLRP